MQELSTLKTATGQDVIGTEAGRGMNGYSGGGCLVMADMMWEIVWYPKFCIGFKIRKSRSEQLLLSGSGHSK